MDEKEDFLRGQRKWKKEEKMNRDIPGKILETVWKLEKIAIDFNGKKIFWGKFKKDFTVILLELVEILINYELINLKKGG